MIGLPSAWVMDGGFVFPLLFRALTTWDVLAGAASSAGSLLASARAFRRALSAHPAGAPAERLITRIRVSEVPGMPVAQVYVPSTHSERTLAPTGGLETGLSTAALLTSCSEVRVAAGSTQAKGARGRSVPRGGPWGQGAAQAEAGAA